MKGLTLAPRLLIPPKLGGAVGRIRLLLALLATGAAFLTRAAAQAEAHPSNEWGAVKSSAARDVRVRFKFVEKVYCRPPTAAEIRLYLPTTITFVDGGVRYWNHFVCGGTWVESGVRQYGTIVYHVTGECAKCCRRQSRRGYGTRRVGSEVPGLR